MYDILIVAACALLGYLLGSVNTSIIVSGCMGTDIRSHGSGNAGATNTLRTLGKKAALLVLIGDLLKAVVAILLAKGIAALAAPQFAGTALSSAPYWAAIGCVLGHNFPVYFGFKGGKGVLTGFMAVTMLDWRVGLISLGIFLILLVFFRYVSLGSIAAAITAPVAAILLHTNLNMILLCSVTGVLIVLRHSANIKRLASGTESKLGSKRKEK